MMQTRFCRTQIPRTLECVVLVFVIKTNIENFTINNKLLICQLSKLLKSRFLNETIFKDSFARTLKDGGAMRDRTADLLRARQALSQLSYSPIKVSILHTNFKGNWWVWVDSNHRPLAYQANALTTWATDPVSSLLLYKPYQSVWTLIVSNHRIRRWSSARFP